MKIALSVGFPWIERSWSFDLGILIRGLQEIGHEALVVAPEGSQYDVQYPVITAGIPAMQTREFWQSQKLDAVLIYTWLTQFGPIVEAIKGAGVCVLSKGDTDGQDGTRLYPRRFWIEAMAGRSTMNSRLRGLWYVARKYAYAYRPINDAILRNLETANATVFETETARRNFYRFLAYYDRLSLKDRLWVIPNPVGREFLSAPVPEAKKNRVVAIGRWDSPQKDAPLMARALERFLGKQPKTEVVLIGSGGEDIFARLLARYPQARYLGVIPRTEILPELREARSILFTSKWEGSPNAANEALVSGCSVVSTMVPGLQDICASGPFGSLARRRTPREVADALGREMMHWERGERSSAAIAACWRSRLAQDQVARQIVRLVESLRGTGV